MSKPPVNSLYLETLLQYYEEEISGEAYFYGLAEHFSERDKTLLLARAERIAAQAVLPLLEKYQLKPRDAHTLRNEGRAEVREHKDFTWQDFMSHIIECYPRYLDEFEALEAMAPVEDLPALQRLTEHEVIAIEFARRELAGAPDSTEPLLEYLGEG